MNDAKKKKTIGSVLKEPPGSPDPRRHYLFYLHALIVEGSDGRPKSDEHGYFEYDDIVKALSSRGFEVISEIRPKETIPSAYADKVAGWIDQLLSKGVPESHIIVVGASKGGLIAALVSDRMKSEKMRYAILAGLFQKVIKSDDSIRLHGHVLSIHDFADKHEISPEAFFEKSDKIAEKRIVVTRTGLGHGLLYTPRPEWVEEVVKWSGIDADPTA